MRKHKWKLLGVLLAVSLLANVGGFFLWPRPDRLTRKRCERIATGMSRADVYALLGPPGDYRTVETEVPFSADWGCLVPSGPPRDVDTILAMMAPGVETLTWRGDGGDIRVYFGPDGVVAREFMVMERVEQSTLENLSWLAKRQWHRCLPER